MSLTILTGDVVLTTVLFEAPRFCVGFACCGRSAPEPQRLPGSASSQQVRELDFESKAAPISGSGNPSFRRERVSQYENLARGAPIAAQS
jgi:hypothetical protein